MTTPDVHPDLQRLSDRLHELQYKASIETDMKIRKGLADEWLKTRREMERIEESLMVV